MAHGSARFPNDVSYAIKADGVRGLGALALGGTHAGARKSCGWLVASSWPWLTLSRDDGTTRLESRCANAWRHQVVYANAFRGTNPLVLAPGGDVVAGPGLKSSLAGRVGSVESA